MDLIVKNARIENGNAAWTADIGVDDGRIAEIRPGLESDSAETLDVGGRLVTSGFVETHIHLDKSRILDRCGTGTGTLEDAIGGVARAKRDFTPAALGGECHRGIDDFIRVRSFWGGHNFRSAAVSTTFSVMRSQKSRKPRFG